MRNIFHQTRHPASFGLSALGLGALLISGCMKNAPQKPEASGPLDNATGGGATVGSAQELVIVSPHSADIQYEFEHAFTAANPGVKLKWLDQGGSSNALTSVIADYQNKKPGEGIGIDVFFGGGSETAQDLAKHRLLQPLPSTYGIPAERGGSPLRGAGSLWCGAVLSGFGVLTNKTVVTRDKLPQPTSWAGLADPKLAGRVIMADPRQSGVGHMICEIILQTQGWDKGWQTLNGMGANVTSWATASSAIPGDIASGEAAMGPTIDFYAATKIGEAGKDKLGYLEFPKEQVITADPIAILRDAPHPELAKKFVAFVLSPAGQKLWMLPKGAPGGPQNASLYRRGILPSLYKPALPNALVAGDPYAGASGFRFNSELASSRYRALNDLVGAVLIDQATALKARRAKNPGDTLAWTPLPEKEFNAIAAKWDDQTFRNETISKWGAAARTHWSS